MNKNIGSLKTTASSRVKPKKGQRFAFFRSFRQGLANLLRRFPLSRARLLGIHTPVPQRRFRRWAGRAALAPLPRRGAEEDFLEAPAHFLPFEYLASHGRKCSQPFESRFGRWDLVVSERLLPSE